MHENINEMDFPKLIDEAVLKKQYRIAIRLQYLHTLKLLSEMKYIDWRINKTNLHYILEMQSKPSSAVFSSLTNIFDWVWYGDFSIQEMEYEQYRETFENYKKSLAKNE